MTDAPPPPHSGIRDDAPPPPSDAGDDAPPSGFRLLLNAARPRASRPQLVGALLCGLLGFGLATQVHSTAGAGFTTARQSDLVDILDSLSSRSDQLRAQIATEQTALAKLTGGNDQTQAAFDEAQKRAAILRILAGTAAATGPGIDLHITDPSHQVTADVLLETLEELRDAGAEAVQITGDAVTPAGGINSGAPTSLAPTSGSPPASASPTVSGGSVRLVASSALVDAPGNNGVLIDGVELTAPFDIVAIGDPPTMTTAMGIPGGVLDTLTRKGGKGVVTQHDVVRVTALHELTAPQYARPAPSSSSG